MKVLDKLKDYAVLTSAIILGISVIGFIAKGIAFSKYNYINTEIGDFSYTILGLIMVGVCIAALTRTR